MNLHQTLAVLLLSATVLAAPPARAEEPASTPSPLDLFREYTRGQLAATGWDRQQSEIAGETLVWWSKGSGPSLVFLHGVSDQAGTWFQVAPHFTDQYRVILIDLPGHGESTPEAGPLPMTTIIEGVEAFLQEEIVKPGQAPPVLVGNSMGAWIALATARRHPTRVGRIVAVNGGPLRPDTGDLNLLPKDREEARALMAAIRDPASPAIPDVVLDDLVRRAPTGQASRMFQANEDLESYLLEDQLDEITTPVDLLWGTSDGYLGKRFSQRLREELPRVRWTAIDGCGHSPQAECPDRFTEALRRVLDLAPPSEPTPPSVDPTPASNPDSSD
ncbi:MAG: alpha/beta hydrolase [Thermoanaerobaculia bacterium]|nr:alpha/beta hydrolase [Thermoanaerobaculia bacterium]